MPFFSTWCGQSTLCYQRKRRSERDNWAQNLSSPERAVFFLPSYFFYFTKRGECQRFGCSFEVISVGVYIIGNTLARRVLHVML